MSLRIKMLVGQILYRVVNLLVRPCRKVRPKSLMLIRLDAIGDYILFRNYIEILKKSAEYQNHHITLVGNAVWRELAVELDSEWIDDFIWIDLKSFSRNIFYRYRILKEVASLGCSIAINPAYSRYFLYDDQIIRATGAPRKIGISGDMSNRSLKQQRKGDAYYTQLFPASEGVVFEFERNREFFSRLLNEKITLAKPVIKADALKCSLNLPKKFAVLFPGATGVNRRWSPAHFIGVAAHLQKQYGLPVVVCGGAGDKETSDAITEALDEQAINLAGKTSLSELVCIISQCSLLVSNETSAPHIATALDVETVVISNGNHFGRFTPYPKEMAPCYHAIYPPEIEKNLNDREKLCARYGNGSNLDINEIAVETAIKKIDMLEPFRKFAVL